MAVYGEREVEGRLEGSGIRRCVGGEGGVREGDKSCDAFLCFDIISPPSSSSDSFGDSKLSIFLSKVFPSSPKIPPPTVKIDSRKTMGLPNRPRPVWVWNLPDVWERLEDLPE